MAREQALLFDDPGQTSIEQQAPLDSMGPALHVFVERLRDLQRIGQRLTSLSDREQLLQQGLSYLKHGLSYEGAHIDLKGSAESKPSRDITVPIRFEQKLIGNIKVPIKQGQSFTRADLEILNCLSGFLAVGLGNIQRLEELRRLASTDPLTGAMNRRQLFKLGTGWTSRTRSTAVIVFDIDHFKRINDLYGHTAGDAVLRFVAARAKENIRETDLLARFGGDEFVILLPDTRLECALMIAERIRTNIHESGVRLKGRFIGSTISAGLACVKGALDLTELIGFADQALYAAKQAGRNSVYFHRVRQGSTVLARYPRASIPVILLNFVGWRATSNGTSFGSSSEGSSSWSRSVS